MGQPEDLVVAHVGSSLSEAEIVRNILEEAGLFAVVPDRNSPVPGIDLTPFDGEYSGAGCVVLVPTSDLDRAREVIVEAKVAGHLLDADVVPSEGEEGEDAP
jgi:hypothetical protein